MTEANKRLREHQEGLLTMINTLSIWNPPRYRFTEELKHQDIKLVNEHTVKAIKSSGYKFAIMEPGVEGGKSGKRFAFRVKESVSNWLAIGVCHKKVVQGKSYGFVFGSIGHGAYMISSNGGSWSHHRADQNNSIKVLLVLFRHLNSRRAMLWRCYCLQSQRRSHSDAACRATNYHTNQCQWMNYTPVCCSTT